MRRFVETLLEHPTLGSMVAHHRRLPGAEPVYAEPARPLPPLLAEALARLGIERLYRHQAEGLDLARAGRNVLAVTPTASGKTLLFATAVLETIHEDPRSHALFLYPTKALAQDQLAGFRELADGFGALAPPRFEIYDGDTPAARRRAIKADPPHVLITNPDMLHAGILAHHHDWARFLARLRWVVLDELHVYRGVFGAHVHHILARLARLAAHHGARPQFIAASATVGNPAGFAQTLVGRPFNVVTASGAPGAALDVLFLNPVAVSPYTVAVRLVAETVRAGLRTLAFTKARRITELLYTWLVQQAPELASRVAPYRAGYLPEERREIERRLDRGELDAVLTTSALELGIDVGGLDAAVLVGYPGSLISSWQRIGRVGRRGRDGLVVLVASPDALDQYVVHHPELFFGRTFEKAVLDPWNPLVAGQHLVCAAAEEPLGAAEVGNFDPRGREVVATLAREARLVQDALGTSWFALRRRPHRDVSPRSASRPFTIVERGRTVGQIDGVRVWYECHPGAIYLHGGRTYRARTLDQERRQVHVERARVDYYTVVLGEKETEILAQLDGRRIGPFPVGLGRLKVTVRIRGYEMRRLAGGEALGQHPLEVPPMVFETVGFWIELPPELPAAFAARSLHFMGGIHAAEHALIGLFPLSAIAERGDVGGISYTGHPQLGRPAIFVYDGVPGGAGLAEQGFADLEQLAARTLELVRECACEAGCPGCIQSPQCGNGNKPLDKAAAVLVLETLTDPAALAALGVAPPEERPGGVLLAASRPAAPAPRAEGRQGIVRAGNVDPSRVVVLDLETQRSAAEVGGWTHTDKMGLALAVVYELERNVYRTYYEADVHRLLLDLVLADRVVGFNVDRFDLAVLSGYTEWDLTRIRTLDLHAEITARIGFRVSLGHLTEANLGAAKAGDGLASLRWWKEGRIDLIERYCRMDVEATRRLYELGAARGFLLCRDREERTVRVPVCW